MLGSVRSVFYGYERRKFGRVYIEEQTLLPHVLKERNWLRVPISNTVTSVFVLIAESPIFSVEEAQVTDDAIHTLRADDCSVDHVVVVGEAQVVGIGQACEDVERFLSVKKSQTCQI